MKKIFFWIPVLCFVGSVCASPRTLRQARSLVPASRHVYTALTSDGEPAFYVLNRENEKGFVIIAADNRAHTVLGYSDTGHWDETDLPDGLRTLLNDYTHEIAVAQDYSALEAMDNVAKPYTPVDPFCSALWGQSAPFNNLCPTYNGKNCKTGCVAIAASQIMNVYRYPTQGIGTNSYKWETENKDSVTLSADFGQTTYRWEDILDSYPDTASAAQRNAIATLVYHCGVAANMDYGPSSSSAVSYEMVKSMIEHFGYDKGIGVLYKDYSPEEVLLDTIATELQQGRPVYISAKTVNKEGHAFVCDGMDADGLLHINWGWYGKSNGFYRISAFQPKTQGTGGAASGKAYTEQMQFYFRIRPDAGGDYVTSLNCENIRISAPSYARNEKVVFYVDSLHNRGFSPWTGHLKLYIYKEDGSFYGTRSYSKSMSPLDVRKYRPKVTYNADFSSYPEGTYKVVIAARSDDAPDAYIPVMRKGTGEWSCKMTIAGDSIYMTDPHIPAAVSLVKEEESSKVRKIITNGQLYIIRNNERYTVQGIKVND